MGRDDGRPRLPTRHCCRTCGMPTLMHCTRASSASQTLPVPSHAPISLLVSTMTTRLCSSSVGGGAKGKRHGKRCGGGGGSSEHSRRAERARPATRPASTAGRRAATPTRTRQHACHLANHRCLAHARPAQEQHRVGDCRGGGGGQRGKWAASDGTRGRAGRLVCGLRCRCPPCASTQACPQLGHARRSLFFHPPSSMSRIMSMWPVTARPTRHVSPTMEPLRLRMAAHGRRRGRQGGEAGEHEEVRQARQCS